MKSGLAKVLVLPRKEGNAGRDTGANRSASPSAWLACFKSTGIDDNYGVVQGKWAAKSETLGQGQRIWHFCPCQKDGYPHESGAIDRDDCPGRPQTQQP